MNSIPHDRQPNQRMFDEFLCRTSNIIRQLERVIHEILITSFIHRMRISQKRCDLELHHGLIIKDQYFDFYRGECKNIFQSADEW